MSSYICIEALSPSFSTLPRYNTIILLFFILLSSSNSWATKGALAALMARTATMAFHAIALLGVTHLGSKSPERLPENKPEKAANAVDLDIIGAWVILSAVGAAVPLLLGAAPSLRTSRARPLVRMWGILIIVGAVCAYVGVRKGDGAALRLELGAAVDLGAIEERCRTVIHAPLRSGEAIPVKATKIFGRIERNTLAGKFDITALVAMGFGVYACLKKTAIGSFEHDSKRSKNDSLAGDWVVQGRLRQRTSTPGSLVRSLELLGLLMASIIVAATVVLHEMYMLKEGGIPMLEGIEAYEQWSCWAASGLVILATVINWWIGKMEPTVSTTRLGGGGVYETDPEGFAKPLEAHIC